MSVVLLVLLTWFNWAQVFTSVLGLSVLTYSIMEGIFMVFDKLRYGIPIFWSPN